MEKRFDKKTFVKNDFDQQKATINTLSIELENLRKEKKVFDNYFETFDSIGIALAEFDVTELRKENKIFQENNIQIESYLDDKENLFHHVSLLKLKRINKEIMKLFGVKNEEEFKNNIFNMATNESLKGMKERQLAFYNGETYFEGENTYQNLNGTKINVLEKIYFSSDSSNVAIVTLNDITESTSYKEKYKFLFEHVPAMILEYDLSEVFNYYKSLNLKNTQEFKQILMDRSTGALKEAFTNLRITDVNKTIVHLLKAPNKRDIIEHFDKYYTDITFNDYIENVVYVFDGVLENQFETVLKTSDEDILDVLINWQVVPGHEKDFSKIFIILVDITKQKELHNQLLDMQKLDSLGLLAGGIAHDLNNLLVPILGSINLIQSNLDTSNETQIHLRRMEETTLRATELIRQLLTYSGKGKFLTGACNFNEVLAKTGYLIDLSATKKVEILYDLEKNLPDIDADETQMQQIVMNLVSNAAMAMDYSGRLLIETKSAFITEKELKESFNRFLLKPGEYIILKVKDEGKGIEEAIRDKIFDPFFSTKDHGRGLGLSVVLGIVLTHKGGIRFDTEIDKGTTFTVIFPKMMASLNRKSLKISSIKEKELNKNAKVLICDDEPSVREIMRLMLKKIGLLVRETSSGLEALELIKNETIDILFLDLIMPNMDGVTVVKEVKKINDSIPIILMSGYNEKEIELQLSGLNISGFLQKPFTLNSIKEKLVEIL